jgi:hypothetical protein
MPTFSSSLTTTSEESRAPCNGEWEGIPPMLDPWQDEWGVLRLCLMSAVCEGFFHVQMPT